MKRCFRIALGVTALGVVLLAVFLVPPHVQTRGIAPLLPGLEDLRGLFAAEDRPVSVEYLVNASQSSSRGTLGHTIFLIRWADGRMFMIDAGMDETAAAEFAELLKWMWGAEDGVFRGDVATQLGGDITSVQGVGFTHLHIDHTQGIGPFCIARGRGAAVYQTSWQAEEHNFNTTEGAALVRDSCLDGRALADTKLMPVAGFSGLGVVALGGHTPGSTLFAAAVGERLWLFSGDTTNTKSAILEDEAKPFLYSYVAVPENTARTAELRGWLARLDAEPDITVIVSHDLDDIRVSGLPEYTATRR